MNARVAGERCALRRVTKANVSVIGGSKPTWWRRRPNGRPSATRRGPIVAPRPPRAAARAAAGSDRVAEAAQREVERRLDVLDLDLRLDRHAGALGALRELAAG